MKGSKETSAGGRNPLSVAIIADGSLAGARAIFSSYCLATGSEISNTTKKQKESSHSPFFSFFFPVAVLNKEVYAFLHPHLRKDLKPQRDLGENTASC